MKSGISVSSGESTPNINAEVDEFEKRSKSASIRFSDIKFDANEIYNQIKEEVKKNEHDYILFWYHDGLAPIMEPLHELGLPVIIHSGDVWGRVFDDKFKQVVDKHKPEIVLVENKCTIPAFRNYLDNDSIKFIWSPHSFEPSVIHDYGEPKLYDIGFSGKFSNYDDRRKLHQSFERMKYTQNIKYKRFVREDAPQWIDYAKNINRCWIMYSSMQADKYLNYKKYFIGNCFSRNFEISGGGSCLLIRRFGDAKDLGYKDSKNCILFDKMSEVPKRVIYYLENKEELHKIINKGYDLVHSRHTLKIHTRNLIDNINRVI